MDVKITQYRTLPGTKQPNRINVQDYPEREEFILRFGRIFRGKDGTSAYEEAVSAGFTGTREEFQQRLADLRGWDDEPTEGSDNMVPSGGIYNAIKTQRDKTDALERWKNDVENRKAGEFKNQGFSTNDYTTSEKNKLSNIESGAQVNKIEKIKVNGTELPIDSPKTVDIGIGGNLLSGNGKNTEVNLSVAYNSADKKIYFYNSDIAGIDATGAIASIDATEFIKDGMVSDVSFNTATQDLTLTFNTDSGKSDIVVNMASLVDTYTAAVNGGLSLDLLNNAFSIKIAPDSKQVLLVDAYGLHIAEGSISTKKLADKSVTWNKLDDDLGDIINVITNFNDMGYIYVPYYSERQALPVANINRFWFVFDSSTPGQLTIDTYVQDGHSEDCEKINHSITIKSIIDTSSIQDKAVTVAKLSQEVSDNIASAQNVVEVSVDLADAFDEVKMLPAEDLAKIKACKNIAALKSADFLYKVNIKDESSLQGAATVDFGYLTQSIPIFIDLSTGKYCNAEYYINDDGSYVINTKTNQYGGINLIPYTAQSNCVICREDGTLTDTEIMILNYQDSFLLYLVNSPTAYIVMSRSNDPNRGESVFIGVQYEGGTDGNTDGGMVILYKAWLDNNKLCVTAGYIKLQNEIEFNGGDIPTIDITGWDGSGFEQNYPRVMTGTISDDDYAKLGKADIIRIAQDGVIFSNAYKTAVLDDGYGFSTDDLFVDSSSPAVISYLFEFRKSPATSSLIFAYKLNIRDKSKAGNFVVLDANGMPVPSNYKPASFSSAVRYDAAQELTVEQMERALLNLGLKVVYINSSEFRTTLTEERANEILQADICIATYSGHQYAFYFSGRATTGLSYFTTLQSNENVLRFTVSDTFALSAIMIAKFVGGGSVRYDTTQNLTTSQQEQVSNNVGVPTVFLRKSELNIVLSDERAAQIANAMEIVLIGGVNDLGQSYLRAWESDAQIHFDKLYDYDRLLRLEFEKQTNKITYGSSYLSDPNAVKFNSRQTLTSAQQLQARTNIDGMKNTPSGDPMHYMYETAGAEWIPYADISTEGLEDWQVETLDTAQAQADGGVWWHNGIFVTVEQNRINYVSTIGNYPANSTTYAFYLKRTNVTTNYKEDILVNNNISLAEAVRISETIRTVLLPTMTTNNIGYAFNNCARLCRVIGTINVSNVSSFSNTFVASPNLRYINLYGLNTNVDFSGNGKLALKSLIFMITNAGTASFTITLAPAVYAAAMADANVQAALTSKPNVTLAYVDVAGSSGAN